MRPTGHLPATLSASVLGFSFAHPRHLVYGKPNVHQLLRHGKTLSYYPGRLPVFCVKLRIIVVELRVIRIAAAVHEWCACKPSTIRKHCSLLRSLVYHWAQPRPFPCVLWKRRMLKHKSSLDGPHGLLRASGGAAPRASTDGRGHATAQLQLIAGTPRIPCRWARLRAQHRSRIAPWRACSNQRNGLRELLL